MDENILVYQLSMTEFDVKDCVQMLRDVYMCDNLDL